MRRQFLIPLTLLALAPAVAADDFAVRRDLMVATQIAARGVKDTRVLNAVRPVERHRFVPAGLAAEAYAGHPLPIGEGQSISQPYIVALMTESLGLKGGEKVLEIGTGSGYQAAVLARLVKEVYTVEIKPKLHDTASALLAPGGRMVLPLGDPLAVQSLVLVTKEASGAPTVKVITSVVFVPMTGKGVTSGP